MTLQAIYYLFGESAVKAYFESVHDESDESIANRISEQEFGVFMYDESENHPSDLLEAFIGWMRYAEISQDLYLAIQKTMAS